MERSDIRGSMLPPGPVPSRGISGISARPKAGIPTELNRVTRGLDPRIRQKDDPIQMDGLPGRAWPSPAMTIGTQPMARIAIMAFLALVLPGWTQLGEHVLRIADSTETAERVVGAFADADVDRHMDVGRYYIGKNNHVGAVNRFKIVVTQFQTSR